MRLCLLLLLALAPAARAETFPCDLSALPAPPPLLLVGEDHCAIPSRGFKKDVAVAAAAGNIYAGLEVAFESAFYPEHAGAAFAELGVESSADSRLYGIESPFPHGLAVSYLAAAAPITDCRHEGVRGLIRSIGRGLQRNSFLSYAWDKAKARHGGYPGVGMARFLDRAQADAPDWRKETESFDGFDFRSFFALEADINREYVALANERYLPAMGFRLSLSPVSEGLVGGLLADRSLESVLLEVRNRDMARSIMGLYCAAAKEGKPLVVVTGAAHTEGIRALLSDADGGRVPTRAVRSDSYGESAAAEALRDLER